MEKTLGFPPVSKADAKILILGSMPGQKSLAANQYYAHPYNRFWPILCALLKHDETCVYSERITLLWQNKIALWDVLKSACRKGSLDSNIDHASLVANDFNYFFTNHKHIRVVFFNGAKAEQLFKKTVLKSLAPVHRDLNYHRLPSTSPAHATLTMQQKLSQWNIIKTYLV